MFKLLFKSFCEGKPKKLASAKKRAMEMFDKINNEQISKSNRSLEEEILKKTSEERKEQTSFPDIKDYKTDEYKNQVNDLIDSYEYINKNSNTKISKPNLSYYIKIEND